MTITVTIDRIGYGYAVHIDKRYIGLFRTYAEAERAVFAPTVRMGLPRP